MMWIADEEMRFFSEIKGYAAWGGHPWVGVEELGESLRRRHDGWPRLKGCNGCNVEDEWCVALAFTCQP